MQALKTPWTERAAQLTRDEVFQEVVAALDELLIEVEATRDDIRARCGYSLKTKAAQAALAKALQVQR